MRNKLVITLSGKDKIGIVEQVTKQILDCGGNVDSSRMARLGGVFTMLMLVSIDENKFDNLKQCIDALKSEGYTVTTCKTETSKPGDTQGWLPYKLEVNGADHEGIIYKITQQLKERSINVETMDTGMVDAPVSGTPLFMMTATLLVPPGISTRALQDDLTTVGDTLNIDIEVSPYKG